MNKIVIENQKPGNPREEWDIIDPSCYYDTSNFKAGDESIQGFTTDISVNLGERILFKIKTTPPTNSYRLDIYRVGYYGGAGARKVTTVDPALELAQEQPPDRVDEVTGLIECGHWQVSAYWDVPSDAVSGIYFAKLLRTDGIVGSNHIVFVVRDDASRSDLLFQTSDTTWQAYNLYGNNSLYRRPNHPARRAYKVSYDRPFCTRVDNVRGIDFIKDWVFGNEYPMVRWLERNGYDVSYSTCIDSDRRGDLIRNHKVFCSVGHDEYWSPGQRANVEAARDSGVHLTFFSGNEVYWKIRWEPSADGTPYRTIACYKETKDSAKIDPLEHVWTGSWRDPRFSPPADGGYPENALTGTLFMVNNDYELRAIKVTAADGKMRFWRNTEIASLPPGAEAILAAGTLGWEWDCDVDNGSRPAGLIHLSTTTVERALLLHDYGTSAGFYPDTATHHMTLYRHKSGALVFSAGTMNWAWGLDTEHDLQRKDADGNVVFPADLRMQQATVNLFADMGVQPETLQTDLRIAMMLEGASDPRSAILAPEQGATVTCGNLLVIRGTAQVAGGVIGGVEISLDGGATWHPAEGRDDWHYQWLPSTEGTIEIKSRAIDDLGAIEREPAIVSIVVLERRS